MSEENQEQEGQEGRQEHKPSENEQRALRMGWRPKEEFKGDPEKWIDADSFVGRTERELPIALGTIRNLERRLIETESVIKDFAKYYEAKEQRAYERAIKDLQKQQREAVEVGDTAKFDSVQAEINQVLKEAKEHATASAKRDQQARPSADFEAWRGRNPWYGSDLDMTRIADEISRSVVAAYPELANGPEIFAKYDEALKLRFGDKINGGNQRRKDPPTVGSGSDDARGGQSGKGGKTYASLPADAKKACDQFVKAGLLTREQYLQDYDWD
jgi:hypothetical protein